MGVVAALPRAHHVAVEPEATAPDSGAARRVERRAAQRSLRDAAAAWCAARAPLPAAMLVALAALAAPGTQTSALRMWTACALALAATLVGLHRLHRAGRRSAAGVDAALAASGALFATLPWLGGSARQPLLAAAAALAATVVAALLAPRRRLAWAMGCVPLSAAASAMAGGASAAWGLVGCGAAAAAVIASHVLARDWQRSRTGALRLQDRLARAERERDHALRRDRDKSRFLAIASHDLRQPVHALCLFAATLQRRLKSTPDEPLTRNLLRAVDGLERSFAALLDISRLDSGSVSPQVETFAVRDLFRRLHMQYAGQAELAGLGLRFSPGGKSVRSDPQLLERILGNLIHNAIKYTTHGGIVVVARTTASHVNLEVWDTGCGIAADEIGRVFDEFYQVGRSERDRSDGLGMGLAIVKRLAVVLGHRLEVASTPGRGTMFRVGVPLGGLAGIPADIVAADTQPMLLESSPMVLVVDDEEPIREGLRVLLQEWGLQVMTAGDAAQAEAAVAALECRIDLVVSDLHLGGGPDGVEVVAAVRRLCGHRVPALLVTGDTAPEHVEAIAASGDPVLFKPVQARRLYEALRAALG